MRKVYYSLETNLHFPLIHQKAHKAKGKFSYCEVIKEINAVHKNFRVVALSATPGKSDDVVEIVKNLLISRIEVRSERCPDVAKYTFKKDIVIEKVRLGYLELIRDEFMGILEPYLRKLVDFKAITGNNISKGWIAIQQKNFSAQNHPNKKEVSSIFSLVQSLVYSLELLERHGINLFLDSFKDENNVTKKKYFVNQDMKLKSFLDKLDNNFMEENPLNMNLNPLPNGNIPDISNQNLNFGHPKFEILKKKVLEYFESGGAKTIIFCEYRDTVKLVYTLLLQLRPKILPRMLIGQGGAISQKDQLTVMKDFRADKVNALITTSVCEEGIDVGEVDLVICFDISSKNATRFVQRIGRTGRKRNGKVLMLATEGKEEEAVRTLIGTKDKLNKSIATNNQIKEALFKNSPRLIPAGSMPTCIETKIKIPTKEEEEQENEKENKKKSLRKTKKNKSTAAVSIASHFEKLPKNRNIEIETLADIAEDPIIPEISIEQNFNSLEQDFKQKVDEILLKLPKNFNLLSQHLNWRKDKELEFFDNLKKVYNEPIQETSLVELNFDFLDTFHDEIIHLPTIQSVPRNISLTLNDSHTIQMESRYGNQFSVPEPFNTPFISSPFHPVSSKIHETRDQPSADVKTSTPLNTGKKRKRFEIEDSPLLKAFERQRNISASSTPLNNKIVESKEINAKNVQNKSIIESSVIESSITDNTTTNIFDRHGRQNRKRRRKAKNGMEFFNLKSIDDIFVDCETEQEQQNIQDFNDDENATPDIFLPTEEDEEDKEIHFDDDDELLMQIPEFTNDNEIIESSLSPPKIIESSISPKTSQPRKIRRREKHKLDFNIDEIFGSAPSDSPYMENVSTHSTSLTLINNENDETKVASSVNIEVSSPQKNPENRVRPNFARLTKALSSPNFLSPNPNKTAKTQNLHETTLLEVSVTSTSNFNSQNKSSFIQPSTSFVIPKQQKNVKRKRARHDFLDTQAGVDGTDSEDEEEIDESMMEFISNDTAIESDHDETIDMQAQYLKSLRSPSTRQNGGFKLPKLPPLPKNFDVFSQDPRLDEEYEDEEDEEMDSFIVDNESQEHTLNETLDELEIAEKILKEKRKNAKRIKQGVKRRKIIRSINDSSDEDGELEELRKQLKYNPD